MKNIKLISFLLFILMFTCSISFADTYNGVPLYNIDYSEFVRPIPRNMPHGNYYNDWNFNSRSDVQNNSSNYDYQILLIQGVLILYIHQVRILPIAFLIVLIVYVINR